MTTSLPPTAPPPPLGAQTGLVPIGPHFPVARDAYLKSYGLAPPEPTDSGMSLSDTFYEYLRIIKKRRWLILSLASVIFTLGALRALMETPIYGSTVRVQIDREAVRVVEGGQVSPFEGQEQEFMRTQIELLLSRSMAERVAGSLRLRNDGEFFAPRGGLSVGTLLSNLKLTSKPRSGTGTGDEPAGASATAIRDRAAAGIVLANRSVRVLPGSRLVDISYIDPDPARAQRVAAAFGEAYIASNIDKRFEANAFAKTFLEDQVNQLKLRIEESERALLDFADRAQIVVANEKSNLAESNLAAANTALGVIVSERIRNEQLWKQVDSSTAINLPQLLQNNVIDGLRQRRALLVTDYQEKLETYKPDYPIMVQIKNRIGELDRQLSSEVRTLKQSYKSAFESSQQQETELKARIETLRLELLDLQKRSIQYNILKRDVDTNRTLYEGLLQRYKQVDVAGGVGANNVFVIDKAEVPNGPTSPNVPRLMLFALMFGLGIGLGAAILLEKLDDTIRSPEDVERVAQMPMLGTIPLVEAGTTMDAEISNPHSLFSESYRSLCTSLQFATDQGLPRSLLITSSGAGEGKSTTALLIARHFASLGLKVLLIDADLRKPSLHIKAGLDNSLGLTNCLTGACSPPEAIQWSNTPNLALLTSGPLPPNAAELLGSARFQSLLTVGAEVYNLIVVDGPPVMGIADAPQLSSTVAATVFVAAAGTARLTGIRAALKRLRFARANLVGAVLTKFEPKRAGYGGYGYGGYGGYGYGYGYGNTYGQTPAPEQAPRIARTGTDG